MKDLTTWEVRKRLPFCAWKTVIQVSDYKIALMEMKRLSRRFGVLYEWQLRGHAKATKNLFKHKGDKR